MGREKNEKISVTLQAKADFSQLINSLNATYKEIQSKASSSDLLNIQGTLNKIQELQIKLKNSLDSGFASTDDLKGMNQMIDKILGEASNLQAKFEAINIRNLEKQLENAKKNIIQTTEAYKKAEKNLDKIISSSLKNVQNAENYQKLVKQTNGDKEELLKIQQDLTSNVQTDIDKETQKKVELQEQKKELEEQKKLQEDLLAKQLEFRNSDSFKRNSRDFSKTGTYKFTGANQSYQKATKFDQYGVPIKYEHLKPVDISKLKEIYATVMTGAKNAESAYNKFIAALGKNNFKATEETLEQLKIHFENLFPENTIKTNINNLTQGLKDVNKNIKDTDNNIKELEAQKNELNSSFDVEKITNGFKDVADSTKLMGAAEDDAAKKQENYEKAVNSGSNQLQNLGEELKEATKRGEDFAEQTSKIQESKQNFDDFTNSLQDAVKRVLSITTSWQIFRRLVHQTYEDVKEIDKAFAQIAMVTNYEVSDMWDRYSEYAEMANKLGQSTQSVIEASGLYYQQGLDTAEVMELTEETMKLATLAGLDFKDATAQMTAAIRGFKLEMSEGERVTDVYAEVAAHAAATVNDLSQAMSATSNIAHSAGMSFENTTAMLATMIEATQEAPKNLGTALKTVIARFTELKENVAGTADSEFEDLDYNKVDKALKSVGVQLKDTNGQFRNLDDVFFDLGKKWNSLDRNSQRYVATIAAGSRQQSRFIALMENYERTMELVDVAQNSAGKSQKQFGKFSDSVEFKINRLKNTWEQVRTSVLSDEAYKGFLDFVNNLVSKLQGLDLTKILAIAPMALILGKTMASQWIKGLTSGLEKGKGLIEKAFTKVTGKKSLDQKLFNIKEYENQIKEAKKIKQEADTELSVISEIKSNFNLPEKIEDADEKVQELETKLNNLNTKNTDGTKNEEIERIKQQLAEATNEAQKLKSELDELNQREGQAQAKSSVYGKIGDEAQKNLKEEERSLGWSKFGSGVGQAIGSAMATGAMMAFTENFDWSEILTTTAVQSGISSITTALTGNWQAALGQLAVGAVSWGLAELNEHFEEQAEKTKLAENGVYRYQQKLKDLEEQQEKLNGDLDKANQEYDKAKEAYDEISKAKDTYEELSNKILLTEEEQENLNSATETLLDYMPNLLAGYDAQGKAILKSGVAYDELIKKQKESLILATKEQNEAEKKAKIGEMNTLIAQRGLSREQKFQIEELQNGSLGNTIATGSHNLPFNPFGTKSYVSLQDILDPKDSGWAEITNFAYVREDAYKSALEALEENNEAFAKLVKETAQEMSGEVFDSISEANEWIAETTEGDDISTYIEFGKKLQEKINELDPSDFDTESYEQYTKKLSDLYLSTAKNDIELFFLQNPKIEKYSDEKQKLLQEVINKTLISSDDIDKLIKDNTEGETVNTEGLNKDYQKLLDSLLNDKALQETESLTDNKVAQIGDFIAKLYIEPIEQLEEELEQLGLSGDTKTYLDQLISEAQSSWQESYDKIAQVYGDGFENSNISNVLYQIGVEGAANFANAFAEFDTNPAAQQFLTGLEEHLEQYGDIPAEVISQLVNYNWADLSYDNLAQAEQEFVDYVKALGINEEKAKEIWEDYKDYLNLFDVTNLTPTSLTVETLEEEITSKLADKVSAGSSLATAIESQLKNGFLTFSESAALEEACTKIGLDASKYINYSLDGNITLDTEGLKKGLEEQRLSEDDILEEVRQTALEKQDQLRAEYAILKATNDILDTEIDRRDVAVDIAKEYWDVAAAMAAANGDPDGAAQYLTNKDKSQLTVKNVNKEDVETRMEAIQAEIDALDNVINSLDKNSEEYKKLEAQINATYNEIEAGIKEKEEAITEAVKANIEARDKAYEDWSKQIETVNEKSKALAETIQGTEWFDAGVDPMYNYTTALERVSKAADKAKTALTELNDDIDPQQAMDKYLDAIHQEAAISEAEARTYAKAIASGQKVVDEKLSKEIERINKATGSNMSTDVSGLYKLYGDRYSIDINRLNSLNINDEFKKMLADEIKSWNDNLDKIEELEDKRLQRIKEFKEAQKSALQGIVNLQEEMKNALKEKYEQEIEDIENKYKAMEEADNDYVSALEESIKRQRELRERETQWNDLADKERKLSLMQRDTSGGNLVATRQLEKEVQTDRQKLLDDSVDDIIDGLKEMYELQKESREAEIEYRKALLDDGMLMQEVAAALEQIHSADDLVAWFESVTDVSNMSKEQLELERLNWEEMYEAKEVYLETSTAQFEEALMVTEEDIQNVVTETSETLTTMADQTLEKISASVKENIEKMQTDLEEARRELQKKWEAYLDALEQTAKDAAGGSSGKVNGSQYTKGGVAEYYFKTAQHGVTKTSANPDILGKNNSVVTGTKIVNYANETANQEYLKSKKSKATDVKSDIGGWKYGFILKKYDFQTKDGKTPTKSQAKSIYELGLKPSQVSDFINFAKKYGYEASYKSSELTGGDPYIWLAKKYAKGGLVNYTGPAWVDGTPNKPEAFLSAEDTKRIGEAAKILAQLPLLNSEVDKNNITNNSIGDTTINLNLTVENISSDYDVDQAVERVKKDIVEAAKYRGSNVILNKRV